MNNPSGSLLLSSACRQALPAFALLGMAAACLGGTARLEPVYLRFDQLTANYQCSLERTDTVEDQRIELIRDGKVLRTDTESVIPTPFNFKDNNLDGLTAYTAKVYYKDRDPLTGDLGPEGSYTMELGSITARPRQVWGTLPTDDAFDGFLATGIDFALNVPAGLTLTIGNSAVNAEGQIDVYGSLALNKVELYGTIRATSDDPESISMAKVTCPSSSVPGTLQIAKPVVLNGGAEGIRVWLEPGATGSRISDLNVVNVIAQGSASFTNNTDLSLTLRPGLVNLSVDGGTVTDIIIDGPDSGSSLSVTDAKINRFIYQSNLLADMSGWKSGGQLVFTDCVVNATPDIKAPVFPDDTQFTGCKFRGSVSFHGGSATATSCHFAKSIYLHGRTPATFDGNTFRDDILLLNDETGVDNPPWHESSAIAPTIAGNNFVGMAALQYGNGDPSLEKYPVDPIGIGANYYGDSLGPAGGCSFLAGLGASAPQYNPQHKPIFAFPDKHNETGSEWNDDEVFPLFWMTGYVLGQNSIPHGGASLLVQDKESLLSVHVVTSHGTIEGLEVTVEFDGKEVPAEGREPILHRDISEYPGDSVSNGGATFNFILPPPSGAKATLKIWRDDTEVAHADVLNERLGRALLVERTLDFKPPPTRPLSLILRPMWVDGYPTPSATAFLADLETYFPSLLGVRQQDINYIIGMADFVLVGNYTGMSTEAMWQAARNRCRNALSLTGLVDEVDFSVNIMPPGSLAAIFGAGTDGLNVDPYRGALYVDAGSFESTLHEFGHAGPELYTTVEQYDMPAYQDSGGMPLTACTLFNNGNSTSGPFDPGSRFRHLPGHASLYSWKCSRECVDIMGSQGCAQTWIDYGTLDPLTEYIYALGPKSAKAAKSAAVPVEPGKKRIMLWGLSEKDPANPSSQRLLAGTLRAFNITSVPSGNIEPGGAFSNEVLAYDANGNLLFTSSYAILASPGSDNYYWTGTYDIPEAAVRLTLKDARGPVFDIQSYGKVTSQLTSPKPGDKLGGDVDVAWDANAWASGQPLQHMLLFSPDGGTSWLDPVFVEGSSYDSSTDGVPVTENLLVKLLSSDGLRVSEAVAEGLQVGPRAPTVKITAPLDGQISEPNLAWTLKGSAVDVDGDMTDSPVWTSSLDGKLGAGNVLANVILSAGEHVLTFTASDSAGRSAAATVTVRVASAPLSTVDLTLAPDALRVIIPGKGPVSSSWASLEPGVTHRAEMLFSNTGTTVNATFTLSLKTPDGSSSELAAKTVDVQPFGTYTLSTEFIPTTKGEYALTGKVEAVTPPDPDKTNNERSWSYFVRSQARIDFETAGDGVGTVTSNPAGTGAGPGTLGLFDLGAQVTLTAVPAAGSVFTGWSGGLDGTDNSDEVAVIGDIKVTATFQAGHQLTVVNGAGSGSYLAGQAVTVTADPPSARRAFDTWTATAGTLADAKAPSTTFTMPAAAATATANFTKIATYHSADYNPADWQIDLFELLRVVTLHNNGLYYKVDDASPDGFAPSATQAVFAPATHHSADYNPADGRIDVFELLRVVTLFNKGLYYKLDAAGVDGYAPANAR